MDFTREPIIETVITPKEGCKLVVRSSKSSGQEEHFVDAVEVVSFGNALFFRSIERPKAFLVPVSDYEVLEVREARMVLKNVGIERTIKIGGGKAQKEVPAEKHEAPHAPEPMPIAAEQGEVETKVDAARTEKRRDRRRHARRRRGREDAAPEAEAAEPGAAAAPELEGEKTSERPTGGTTFISPLLPPPSTLISETIARYRDNALFREAFYAKGEGEEETGEEGTQHEAVGEPVSREHEDLLEVLDMRSISLEPSEFGSFGMADEDAVVPPFIEEEAPPTELSESEVKDYPEQNAK